MARDRVGFPGFSRRQESGAARGCAAHGLCAQSPGEYLALRYGHCLEGHSEIPGLGLGVSMGVHMSVGGFPLSASVTI